MDKYRVRTRLNGWAILSGGRHWEVVALHPLTGTRIFTWEVDTMQEAKDYARAHRAPVEFLDNRLAFDERSAGYVAIGAYSVGTWHRVAMSSVCDGNTPEEAVWNSLETYRGNPLDLDGPRLMVRMSGEEEQSLRYYPIIDNPTLQGGHTLNGGFIDKRGDGRQK